MPAEGRGLVGFIDKARANGARAETDGGAVRHLVGRPRRGDNRTPGNRARRGGRRTFAAEVRVSVLQLLQGDTNPRSNRHRPRGSAIDFRCRPLVECRSPEALEALGRLVWRQKTKKVSRPAGSLLQRLATMPSGKG
jgi:hypothetical protein